MKRIYLAMIAFAMGTFSMAQETITDHTAPSCASFPNGLATYFNWTGGNGYVSGTNGFGDTLVVQKFDYSSGVDNGGQGTIDGLSMWIPVKTDAGNGTSVSLVVWEDNNGAPGAVIESQSVTIANIDTAIASATPITSGTTVLGIYNVDVTFTSANIPANGTFWAGLDITNTGNGDTVVVMTTQPTSSGGTADFPLAMTHAGTVSSALGFYGYGNIADIANYIFPTVTYTNASINEIEASYEIKAYPNPASDIFRIELPDSRTNQIDILGLTGQVVKTINVTNLNVTVDLSDLNDGVYMYQLKDNNGKVLTTRKLVVQK